MAVSGTILASGQVSGNVGGFTTASVSPTPFALQILTINASRGASALPTAPTTLSGNGLTWVLISTLSYDNAGVGRAAAWVYRALASAPSTGTLTASGMGLNADSNVIYQWQEFTGVLPSGSNGADAVRQVVNSTAGSSSTPSVTLAAFGNANNATFGYVAGRGNANPTTASAGTGFTLLNSRYNNTQVQTIFAATEWRADNDTTPDFGFSASDGAGGWMVCGIEIVAATLKDLVPTITVAITTPVTLDVTGSGIPLGDTDLIAAVTMPVTLTVRRPNYVRPRREILWVSDYTGEQRCAIT